MLIDILIGVFIVAMMVIGVAMGLMFEYHFAEMARAAATREESAARRQKWKDLKRRNRQCMKI